MTPSDAPSDAGSGVDSDVSALLAERVGLKSLVECCLLVEEGVAGVKDIDLGMMQGAGIVPGPFARADAAGLDHTLAALERAAERWGEDFAPPLLLRRLVAQGRLGRASGQGFFAYARPDDDLDQPANVLLETRGAVAIAWLSRKPVNPIAPELIADLETIWRRVDGDPAIGALVIASTNQFAFSAGADLKALTAMSPEEATAMVERCHALLRGFEDSSTITIAAVNALALGGGCELAMGCDLRIAAESASFGLPEITLGVLPGFGGTQRLRRLVGGAKGLEMMLTGDPIDAGEALRLGLVNEVVEDHELFDVTLAWADRLAAQAPLARGFIKRTADRDPREAGMAAERVAFTDAFKTADAREGIAAFVQKRRPTFTGR